MDEAFEKLNARRKRGDAFDVVRRIEGVAEVVILAIVFYLVWIYWYNGRFTIRPFFGRGKYVFMGVYAAIAYIVFRMCNAFEFGMMKQQDVIFSQAVAIMLTNFVEYFIVALIFNRLATPVPMLFLTLVDVAFISALCALYNWIYIKTHVPRRLVMVYGGGGGQRLESKMASRPDKYEIVKALSADDGFESILSEIVEFDGVVLSDVSAEFRNDILKHCYIYGLRVYAEPKLSDIILRGGEVIDLFDVPLVLVRGRGLSGVERALKRLFDITIVAVSMIPALPIMGLVALAIKLDDGGPVFYRQERVTAYGRRFQILKFRSMVVDAERDGEDIPASDRDARITRVGRFIRACRLDELPQFFNILKGEMSLVGPRPERTEHVERYLGEIPEFVYRYKVPAGLTGYAQVFGAYNTTAYDKLRLDMMYIENYSLWLDLKLVLMTIRILFKGESTKGFEVTDERRQVGGEVRSGRK